MSLPIHPLLRAVAVLVVALIAMPGLPAAAQGAGTAPVGDSVVTYGDRWEQQADFSSSDELFLSHANMQLTAFAYVETSEISVTSVDAALDMFASEFTGVFDPGTSHVVTSGVSADATAWRLYAATASSIPTAFVITANVSAQPGTVVLTLVMAPAGSLDIALMDASSDIQVDGQPVSIAALDPAQLVAAIEGDTDPAIALPSSPAGATTPGGGPSSPAGPVVVNGIDYRAIDAPATCDRIGWAVTDPSQLPATEPELDYRGACAGGASYVARCGTVPGERADTRYITCEITALVTDGPQEFAFDMFELFEADGDSEYVDMGMSFGNEAMFPSGEAPQDATVSGSASFALDATATEPLLLEIRPPSLPAGAEPAVIVIEGPLQDLAVFTT